MILRKTVLVRRDKEMHMALITREVEGLKYDILFALISVEDKPIGESFQALNACYFRKTLSISKRQRSIYSYHVDR